MGNMSRVQWKVLAVALWAGIPLSWQPLWGQAPGVGVQAGSQKKQQTKLGTTQAQADQRGTQDSPLVVDVLSHPKSPQETAEEKNAAERKDFVNRWTLRFTGAAAVCTGLLVIVGGLGVWAALRTLYTIEKQVAVLINSERAWVLVQPVQTTPLKPVTPDMPYNFFRFTITNRGKTVARLIKFQSGGFLAEKGQTLDETPSYEPHESTGFNPGGTPATEIIHSGVFAPEEPNPMGVRIAVPLNADQIAKMELGDLEFYVFGRIGYFDFAEKERAVQFCYRYVGENQDFTGEVARWVLDGPLAYNSHT